MTFAKRHVSQYSFKNMRKMTMYFELRKTNQIKHILNLFLFINLFFLSHDIADGKEEN